MKKYLPLREIHIDDNDSRCCAQECQFLKTDDGNRWACAANDLYRLWLNHDHKPLRNPDCLHAAG